jgi:hypothetical protein
MEHVANEKMEKIARAIARLHRYNYRGEYVAIGDVQHEYFSQAAFDEMKKLESDRERVFRIKDDLRGCTESIKSYEQKIQQLDSYIAELKQKADEFVEQALTVQEGVEQVLESISECNHKIRTVRQNLTELQLAARNERFNIEWLINQLNQIPDPNIRPVPWCFNKPSWWGDFSPATVRCYKAESPQVLPATVRCYKAESPQVLPATVRCYKAESPQASLASMSAL